MKEGIKKLFKIIIVIGAGYIAYKLLKHILKPSNTK